MKATTTVLPLYWLMWTCLPWPRLMAKSGEGRGSTAARAGAAAMGSRVSAVITRKKRIASVYRRGQAFHAGDHGALAAQFEAAIVAGAGDSVVAFRSHGHLFKFLGELRAVGREILAGGVNAIPLHGIEQHHAAGFLVLLQVERAAAPVRGDVVGARLAGILLQHDGMLQFEERVLEEHALGIWEDEAQPQVEWRIVEDRVLPRPAIGRAAHHG